MNNFLGWTKKLNSKGTSLIRGTDASNISSMGLNDTLNKTETKTHTFCTSAFVSPVEPLEDSELITLRDTDSSVLDFNNQHVGLREDAHGYVTSNWSKFNRIVKKVSKSLMQPDWICF